LSTIFISTQSCPKTTRPSPFFTDLVNGIGTVRLH
jgi:hypothetical protein